MSEDRRTVYAEEALRLAEFRLREKLPFLSAALAVPQKMWTDRGSGTDACMLYWNAEEVLALFMQGPHKLQRRYLHLLLHGLYLHRFRGDAYPESVWWLACDLMTEYRIDRLHVPGFEWPVPGSRSCHYRRLKEEGVWFQERCLAEWLMSADQELLKELRTVFQKDDHAFWRMGEALPPAAGQHEQMRREETIRMTETVHRWRTVFEQLELHTQEHKRQAGGSAGAGRQQIVLEKERGYDYRRFLKQFAVSKEELLLDMDSFDPIAYDYSRRMYENLVLLEPLEYKDVQKLQEFVIAIDTSGSCSGEVVRQFLTETWEILQQKENFFRDMRIHLIQCDCLVQEHVCVTSEKEWKEYLERMTIKGHGDTDFTPVFRLVDRMVQDGELKNLKGLLYFTDGDGIYPAEKPDYETAFVFLNEELRKGKTPAWGLTLTLDRELGAKR